MNKLKENLLKRYGIAEYFLAIVGVILICIQVYRYATSSLDDLGLEVGVFVIAFLCLIAPLTLLNLIRKARGLDPK